MKDFGCAGGGWSQEISHPDSWQMNLLLIAKDMVRTLQPQGLQVCGSHEKSAKKKPGGPGGPGPPPPAGGGACVRQGNGCAGFLVMAIRGTIAGRNDW